MKIPASKVPAQVWADKMRTEGDLSEAESERLRRWDSSKQVYRVNSTLWDELKIDNKDEIPVSVFSKLPYDCIFIERKDSLDKYIRQRRGWKTVKPADIIIEKRDGAYWIRKDFGNRDFFAVSFPPER